MREGDFRGFHVAKLTENWIFSGPARIFFDLYFSDKGCSFFFGSISALFAKSSSWNKDLIISSARKTGFLVAFISKKKGSES